LKSFTQQDVVTTPAPVCTSEREAGATADISLQSLAAAIARLTLEDRARLVAIVLSGAVP
jgi:hypothetical protein